MTTDPIAPDLGPTTAIRLERRGRMVEVMLDRPKRRNAMDQTMVEELLRTVVALRRSGAPETRVLVLRGRGGCFCAGGDLAGLASGADLTSGADQADVEGEDPIADLNRSLAGFWSPSIRCHFRSWRRWRGRRWAAASAWCASPTWCWPPPTLDSVCPRPGSAFCRARSCPSPSPGSAGPRWLAWRSPESSSTRTRRTASA